MPPGGGPAAWALAVRFCVDMSGMRARARGPPAARGGSGSSGRQPAAAARSRIQAGAVRKRPWHRQRAPALSCRSRGARPTSMASERPRLRRAPASACPPAPTRGHRSPDPPPPALPRSRGSSRDLPPAGATGPPTTRPSGRPRPRLRPPAPRRRPFVPASPGACSATRPASCAQPPAEYEGRDRSRPEDLLMADTAWGGLTWPASTPNAVCLGNESRSPLFANDTYGSLGDAGRLEGGSGETRRTSSSGGCAQAPGPRKLHRNRPEAAEPGAPPARYLRGLSRSAAAAVQRN